MKTMYFLTLFIVCFSCTSRQSDNHISDKYRIEDELFIAKHTEALQQEILRRTVKYTDMPIENSRVYFGSDSLTTFFLMDITSKPRLIFCFSANTCPPCVEKAIDLTKAIFTDYLVNEQIIITGDYPLRLRDNCYGKRMLTGINAPVEEIEAPFFFVLDENFKISFLHIFNKTNPDLTKIYLEEILKKIL